jgi:lipopolysaccharide assembly outer membrane protein LptD (OstA)
MKFLCTVLLSVVSTMPVYAGKQSLAADSVDYDGKKIQMMGAVNIQHEFGNICCDKGVLIMKEASAKRLDFDRILLHGHVNVVLHDGSILTAEEADINCETLEGVFSSSAPEKVVYSTRVEENGSFVPVKTVSRSMRVTVKRAANSDKSEYIIHDIQAEGAVNIEYQIEK